MSSIANVDRLQGLRSKIRELGPRHDTEVLQMMIDLYAPEVELNGGGLTIQQDVAYGSDDRQRLDIYGPGRGDCPVLLYIPGGGFIGGDRRATNEFYRNIGIHFAQHGAVTVIMSYRLAPIHTFPAAAQDVSAALQWVGEEVQHYGGNPERLFVFGQSAGATHLASYLFDPTFHRGGPSIERAILMSGLFRVTKKIVRPNIAAYFGEDESLYKERSPISHIAHCCAPLWLAFADLDPEILATSTLELAMELSRLRLQSPPISWIEGHNHTSTVFSIGSRDDAPAALIRQIMGL